MTAKHTVLAGRAFQETLVTLLSKTDELRPEREMTGIVPTATVSQGQTKLRTRPRYSCGNLTCR